jgi:aspartyl-tRNA(Asn)/glutamyl-tRNA(Gln) amidotransferase subunit C
VAVSEEDVRHVAALARLGVDDSRLPSLVSELNGILEHMEELGRVETSGGRMADGGVRTTATPMRSDVDGKAIPLANLRESFAPEMRDGFFLVPRLETHEGEGERSP